MGNATSIEHRKQSTALSLADSQRLHSLKKTMAHLMNLALAMGEPIDEKGARYD